MALNSLIIACTFSDVDPKIINQIINVESSRNPIAINVNTQKGLQKYKFKIPKTMEEAIAIANDAIAKGYSVDLGYMQVNSLNLKGLGYTVKDMFDPCKNIAAGSKIFKNFHYQAKIKLDMEDVTQHALSAYNTGSFYRGFSNGYVAKYQMSKPQKKQKTAQPFSIQETAIVVNYQLIANLEDKSMKAKITVSPTISENKSDAKMPGTQIFFTPDEAESNGAMLEQALSEKDAWESNIVDDPSSTAIVINGREVGKK